MHDKSWCVHDSVGWYDTVILSCLISNVYCNCIVQDSQHHYKDIDTICKCALVSCTLSQSIGLFCLFVCFCLFCLVWFFVFFGGCVLVLSVITCSFYKFLDRVLFHHDGCGHYSQINIANHSKKNMAYRFSNDSSARGCCKNFEKV